VRSLADWVAAQLPSGTFDVVIAGDEVTRAKPDPEAYLRAAEALGVPIERCMAFEDSPKGLRAAFASGAVSIGLPNMVDLTGERSHDLWPSLAGLDAGRLRTAFHGLRHGPSASI